METSDNDLSSSNNGKIAKSTNNFTTYPAQSRQHEHAMWNSVGPSVNRLASSTSFKAEKDGLSLNSRSYTETQGDLGAKMDMVYGLISMLNNQSREQMTQTLLAMSHSSDRCGTMRQSGCISLLVQLIHSEEEDCTPELRDRAAQALHNLIHCHQDDKQGRTEVRILGMLEKIRHCANTLNETSEHTEEENTIASALMKLSFDEPHRAAMCQLGALHTMAKLVQNDTKYHGQNNKQCIVLRRYAGMALTNLTFGQGNNKSALCCKTEFMKALVLQLSAPSDHLRQVTASVLRNLSWRADSKSKQLLRDVGAVTALMRSAMEASKEPTLKSILSALWNFSAHCEENKVDICQVEGAISFLVEKMKSNTTTSLTIVENAGGVMRNISSHIAVQDNYREILRQHRALPLLLEQLRSPSLTVVSNACGTLWNLTSRCPQDQATLCSLGAGPMLSCLIHSRHKMIAMGASAALKNLLAAQPSAADSSLIDSNSTGMPTLLIRKRKALEKELDANLAETCDNLDSSEPASPLTPQSVPISTLTAHHLKTSTPNSSVHSLSGNNNTADHSPLTRSITPSPTPSLLHLNNTTPTSSHYNQADESHYEKSQSDLTEKSHYESHSHFSHGNSHDMSHHNTNTPTSVSHCDPNEDREDLASNYSVPISEKSYNNLSYNQGRNVENLSHKEENPPLGYSDVERQSRDNLSNTVDQIEEMTSKLTVDDQCSFEQSENDQNNTSNGGIDKEINSLDNFHENSNFSTSEHRKSPSGYNSRDESFVQSDIRGENSLDNANFSHNSSKNSHDSIHGGLDIKQNSSPRSDTSRKNGDENRTHGLEIGSQGSEIDQRSEVRSHFNNSEHEQSDLEREQLSFSKMEEPYYHTDLDEDSNEPSNMDQPTNYSLRYTEKQKRSDPNSSDVGRRGTKFTEDHEGAASDCLKTFCTEGTPYNFSNSTSLSDLRITDGGEFSACKTPDDSKPPSGRGSPSPGSELAKRLPGDRGPFTERGDPDETPLMFSRCSSLDSVSSCGEQEPARGDETVPAEDRYSVVSEFSRMTSGMISPSDLPDSPIYTAPVSPSPRGGAKFTFPSGQNLSRGKNPTGKFPTSGSNVGKGAQQRPSVFEDTVATYKDEEEESGVPSTSSLQPSSLPPPPSAKDELKYYATEESPMNLTAWSSLSDLTINTNTSVSATQPTPYGDRDVFGREGGGQMQFIGEHEDNNDHHNVNRNVEDRESLGDILVGSDGERIVGRDLCTNGERPPVENTVGERLIGGDVGGREEMKKSLNDGEILAACIQAGMESAKAANKKDDTNNKSSNHHLYSSEEDEEDCHELLAQTIQLGMASTHRSQTKSTSSSKRDTSNQPSSQPLSSSNLDSSQDEEGDEALLAQCIQLGMSSTRFQKPKSGTSSNPGASSQAASNQNKPAVSGSNPSHSPAELKLDFSDEDILQQCILEGMSSYVSEASNDETLLAECIRAGMNKYKQHMSKRKQASSSSAPSQPPQRQTSQTDFDLDQWANDGQDDSALLLEQCIQAGISHKSKNAPAPSAHPRSPTRTDGGPIEDDSGGQLLANTARSEREQDSDVDKLLLARIEKHIQENNQKQTNVEESFSQDKNETLNDRQINGPKLNGDLIVTLRNVRQDVIENKPFYLNSSTKNLEGRRPSKVENKLISSLIKSTGSMEKSMERSWLVTDNLNDDLCEGLDTTASPDEGEFIEKSHDRGKSLIRTLESKLVADEMKASMTHTWSEDSSSSFPTVSLSPPSCLRTTFVYGEEKNSLDINPTSGKISGIFACDSLTSSPAKKSVALVNPFPETTKHLNQSVVDQKGHKANLIEELAKKSYGAPINHESIMVMNAQPKVTPHILELECGKLGLISSLEFEDLNAVKPPSMMDSISCMDRSIFNKGLIGSMTSMHSSVNLDSVKPPSYFDEVSLMLDSSMDASICNIDSIVSEVADDDDVTLVEDIPLDTQSPLLKRRLTPKQKRTLSKERYNTFTIQQSPTPSPPEKLTPKQRREQNRDRYSTRTIEDEVNHETFVVTDDTLTLMSGNNSEVEDLEYDEEHVQLPKPAAQNNKSITNNNKNTIVENRNDRSSPGKISKLQAPRVTIPQFNTDSSSTQKSSIPAPVKSMMPLQRQGTFTMDEPSHIPLPSVSAGPTPTKTTASSKHTTIVPGIKLRNNSQPNIKRPGFRSSLSNSNLRGELNSSNPGSLNRRSYVDLSSSKSNEYGKTTGVYGKMSAGAYGKSSEYAKSSARKSTSSSSLNYSNSSLNSNGSGNSPTGGKQPGAGKSPVASKIANLWKKVEDSKKAKTPVKKDTRVWITK